MLVMLSDCNLNDSLNPNSFPAPSRYPSSDVDLHLVFPKISRPPWILLYLRFGVVLLQLRDLYVYVSCLKVGVGVYKCLQTGRIFSRRLSTLHSDHGWEGWPWCFCGKRSGWGLRAFCPRHVCFWVRAGIFVLHFWHFHKVVLYRVLGHVLGKKCNCILFFSPSQLINPTFS